MTRSRLELLEATWLSHVVIMPCGDEAQEQASIAPWRARVGCRNRSWFPAKCEPFSEIFLSETLAFHVLIQEASQVELAEPPPDVTVTTDACRYGVLINLMWPLE
jgi:hypothetical protein